MEVIRHGYLFPVKQTRYFCCHHCNCIFKEEVPTGLHGETMIECPECGKENFIKDGKTKEDAAENLWLDLRR